MATQVALLLHCYQPFRNSRFVTVQPFNSRFSRNGELIPLPDGTPAKNWNKDITAQCYKPCAEAGLYSRVNFNFGPTLLHWSEQEAKDVYKLVIDSDKRSVEKYKGHGNAIAQPLNHPILPLTKTKREKDLYVKWAIKDFEKHYKRKPEGMWLPEAAVCKETLEVLHENDIKFTVLSPHTASRIKPVNGDDSTWIDIGGGRIDPSRAYKYFLDDKKEKFISLFFYDENVGKAMAFSSDGIYNCEHSFIRRLLHAKDDRREHTQLIHSSTDGETLGHHHQHALKPVIDAINLLDSDAGMMAYKMGLINYGLFLEQNPPTWEAKIFDKTAWSCFHGLKRWGAEEGGHCDCGTGDSTWRVDLRRAFDVLKEEVDNTFIDLAPNYFKSPQLALEDYISVINSPENINSFFETHLKNGADIEKAYNLLEMEKFGMFMYTSCAWFHESPNRIEPFASIISANSAVHLLKTFKPKSNIEEKFLDLLSKVNGGVDLYQNAGKINKTGLTSVA